ncbi:MAG: NADH-quinone oxidoreductase subunit D, partial [Oligoflexia bacterium]|nr:NADH-quinone oxidoreductase subunit D [Oligoflexia bacterium]
MAITAAKLPKNTDPVKWVEIGGVRVPVDLVGTGWPDPYLDIDSYDPESDLMALNMGPQHPSTHGVLRIKLWLDGETCVKAVPYVGYLHRGVEKLCEKLTYAQITPIVDKNDYVSPMMNELAINMAFEQLLEIEAPPRAQVIRTILAEIQRIASHLIAVGTWGLDMGGAIGGGTTLFLYCLREREMILDLFEELTGCRFHYNTHTVGGNRHDIPVGWDKKAKAVLALISERTHMYERFLTDNPICQQRSCGIAVVDPLLAMECGVSGPILRASGVDFDMRRDAPYAAYDQVDVRVAVRTEGDAMARTLVRIDEMRESARIATLLLDGVPEGPICALKPVKLPGAVKIKDGKVGYAAIESPRGELGTYVIANTERKLTPHPYRCKIRAPSYHALSLLP